MDLDSIKDLLDNADLGSLLPDLGSLLGKLELFMRILVIAAPLVMMVMGLLYLFAAPKEANHHFGYRCYFGMGSVDAWRFTQRIAGITWIALGAILTIVMLIVSGSFAALNAMDMVTKAISCVLWQAGLLLAAHFGIRAVVTFRFDRHGEYRDHRKLAEFMKRLQAKK